MRFTRASYRPLTRYSSVAQIVAETEDGLRTHEFGFRISNPRCEPLRAEAATPAAVTAQAWTTIGELLGPGAGLSYHYRR